MPSKISIHATVIVTNHDGKILLIPSTNGAWALPGGRVEVGDRIDTAAIRSLKKETGLNAAPEDLMFIRFVNQPGPYHSIQTCFLLTILKLEAHSDLHWFDPEELPENIYPPHVSLLVTYLNNEAGVYVEESRE